MNLNMDIINISVAVYALLIGLMKIIGDYGFYTRKNTTRIYFSQMLHLECVLLITVIAANFFQQVIKDAKCMIFMVDVAYAIYYLTYYTILCIFVFYSTDYISRFCRSEVKPAKYTIPVTVLSAALWMTSSFNGIALGFDGERFVRGPLYMVGQIGGYLLIAEPFYYIIKHRNNLKRKNILVLLSFVVLPLIGVVLRTVWPGPEYMPFMILLALILMDNTIQHEQEALILQQEDRIARDRIKILISQIRPHFLYNVLNSIYVLCEKDPEKAQEAIGNFSEYLRSNIDSLQQDECIPFNKEMNLVTTYVSLEKMRFREKLEVKYNIQEEFFKLPALTVQILVENAVKHGIHKKKDGGTIRVTTFSDADFYVIVVSDNGVGFDTSTMNKDNGMHIGLDNLRERLKNMCGGHLVIESVINEGTVAKVTIPKKP